MNHKEFITKEKSMLIAPAGHGKTHSIVDCLLHTLGKQLILTHTHAGIASLKEKINKAGVSQKRFHIETISGYAQKYVHAYCIESEIPSQDNSKEYYPFLIRKAKEIIKNPIIHKSIQASYSGIFVDEYQDCTYKQHELLTILGEILPIRIFGDPLQGIFYFDDPLVNLDDDMHMQGFIENKYTLTIPWRWKGINEKLGQALQDIRSKIERKEQINFLDYPVIEFVKIDIESNLYLPNKPYYKEFNKRLGSKSLLVLHPDSTSVNPRKKVISAFKTPINLLESIDDKDFYVLTKLIDSINETNIYGVIHEICTSLFSKTELKKWLTEKKVVSKGSKRPKEKNISDSLNNLFKEALESKQSVKYSQILKFISKIENIRCYRKELFYSLCSAIESSANEKSVYESMIEVRNNIRRAGRKVHGRCIGTTLLTKGLEFENVVILNVNKFIDPKHLYVALTRASKTLTVFGTSPILIPLYD